MGDSVAERRAASFKRVKELKRRKKKADTAMLRAENGLGMTAKEAKKAFKASWKAILDAIRDFFETDSSCRKCTD